MTTVHRENTSSPLPLLPPAGSNFRTVGFCVMADFLTAAECERLLGLIEDYRRRHFVPEVVRPGRAGRALRYRVIDGLKVKTYLPDIEKLYRRVNAAVEQIAGQSCAPLKNEQVGVNVNVTPPGGEYRWHYDRNAVTAILYLNEIEGGGETEFYPNYRLLLGKFRYSKIQQWLDSALQSELARKFFGTRILFAPRRGSLLVMRADRCLHSVRPVGGATDRINVIMAFDAPDAQFAIEQNLDAYLYQPDDETAGSDPNYK